MPQVPYRERADSDAMNNSEAARPPLEIRRDDIVSANATALIRALNDELAERYPEEGANFFRLDPDEVAEGRGAFFIAYEGEQALACGAIRRIDENTAEIKRMYVRPRERGRGIARRLLAALEAEGRRLGVKSLVLETGERQKEALDLYRKAGFRRIPAFGEYIEAPLSVCMEKKL